MRTMAKRKCRENQRKCLNKSLTYIILCLLHLHINKLTLSIMYVKDIIAKIKL
jgi:hypothetical protein